ncbi:MAG: hypothetical protein KAG89_08055 [Fulvimarina manganoxydans]|nr:hypothetical protein [Fulvimarina manganoxydans]
MTATDHCSTTELQEVAALRPRQSVQVLEAAAGSPAKRRLPSQVGVNLEYIQTLESRREESIDWPRNAVQTEFHTIQLLTRSFQAVLRTVDSRQMSTVHEVCALSTRLEVENWR